MTLEQQIPRDPHFNEIAMYAAADDQRGWDTDEFEDQIASTVIGLYESLCVPKAQDAYPVRFGADELEKVRQCGAYVSHPSRVVFDHELDAPLDSIYTGIAVHSLIARGHAPDSESYRNFYVLKRAPTIPRPLYAVASGTPYSFTILSATKDGRLETLKQYFTAVGTRIHPAAFDFGKTKRWPYVTFNNLLGKTHAQVLVELVTATANNIADKRHTWSIASTDSGVKVAVGCYHEEVKSLLYARSLPLTTTGRRRPILHLVAAHRRRLREGIDIDIREFLRGVKRVEMHGAVFDVAPPAARQTEAA